MKETEQRDFGVTQECTNCNTLCFQQSYLKTVKCGNCPVTALKEQAEEADGGRADKVFLLKDGDIKCEECWLQNIFQDMVNKAKRDQREA